MYDLEKEILKRDYSNKLTLIHSSPLQYLHIVYALCIKRRAKDGPGLSAESIYGQNGH